MAKKTLLKKAFEEAGLPKTNGNLQGAIFLVTTMDEPQKVSKVLVDYAKSKEQFLLLGVFAEGKLLGKDFVAQLAKMPSRTELLAKLVGGMKLKWRIKKIPLQIHAKGGIGLDILFWDDHNAFAFGFRGGAGDKRRCG